jgi:integrase/recombinase XerD
MARIEKRRTPPVSRQTPLEALMREHLLALEVQNYSEFTVRGRSGHIGFFLDWLKDRGIVEPVEVTRPVLESYQRYLFHWGSLQETDHIVR